MLPSGSVAELKEVVNQLRNQLGRGGQVKVDFTDDLKEFEGVEFNTPGEKFEAILERLTKSVLDFSDEIADAVTEQCPDFEVDSLLVQGFVRSILIARLNERNRNYFSSSILSHYIRGLSQKS